MAEPQYSERLAILEAETLESGTHRHAFCVEETHGRINARRNLVGLRVARVWNYRPANATNFKTIHAFKEYLNKIDFGSQ